MRQYFYHLCLASVFLMLTGCLGPVKTPVIKKYTLDAEQSLNTARKGKGSAVLLVTAPTASPGYESSEMIYTERAHQLNHFATNTWVAPPAKMLAPLLATSLQHSGCFRAVVAPPYSSAADLTLNTELLTLQQEFTQHHSQVRMAVLLTLINNADSQVVTTRQFEAIASASANTPYAGVIAANQAAREILYRINRFMCSHAN